MVIDSTNFEENVRKSFQKFKKHMDILEKRLTSFEEDLSVLKKEISSIRQNLAKSSGFSKSSKGNEGVDAMMSNDDFMMSNDDAMMIDVHRWNTTKKKLQVDKHNEQLGELRTELEKQFRELTDRELSVFLTIYDLEEQLDGVTYYDLAKALALSDITIKSTVYRLFVKGLPLGKRRFFNGKVSLFIKKEFRDLHLADKLIKLHKKQDKEGKLFDN